jgi:hypothetical protein
MRYQLLLRRMSSDRPSLTMFGLHEAIALNAYSVISCEQNDSGDGRFWHGGSRAVVVGKSFGLYLRSLLKAYLAPFQMYRMLRVRSGHTVQNSGRAVRSALGVAPSWMHAHSAGKHIIPPWYFTTVV